MEVLKAQSTQESALANLSLPTFATLPSSSESRCNHPCIHASVQAKVTLAGAFKETALAQSSPKFLEARTSQQTGIVATF